MLLLVSFLSHSLSFSLEGRGEGKKRRRSNYVSFEGNFSGWEFENEDKMDKEFKSLSLNQTCCRNSMSLVWGFFFFFFLRLSLKRKDNLTKEKRISVS